MVPAASQEQEPQQRFNIGLLPLLVNLDNPDPDHVYGWVTDDAFSGRHADMPVYPHAGGYGVVGIDTDSWTGAARPACTSWGSRTNRHDPLSTWQTLAENITDTALTVTVHDLAGGDVAQFRVIASDGVDTGRDDSAEVVVPRKDPVPEIGAPVPDARFAAGACTGPEHTYEFPGDYSVLVEVKLDDQPIGSATTEHTVQRAAGSETVRLAGSNHFGTAATISEATFDPGVPVAQVATGQVFADTLSGGPSDALRGGPIPLATSDLLPADTRAELERLEPERIVVLGGSAAISDDVLTELDGLTDGSASRLEGSNRFSTAGAISADTFPAESLDVADVATGTGVADALAGGPPAARRSASLVLATSGQLPEATRAELERLAPKRIVVLGGTAAIGDELLDDLQGLTRDR